jgi:hypothetical protein
MRARDEQEMMSRARIRLKVLRHQPMWALSQYRLGVMFEEVLDAEWAVAFFDDLAEDVSVIAARDYARISGVDSHFVSPLLGA